MRVPKLVSGPGHQLILLLCCALSGCGGGNGSADDQRTENTLPTIALNDGDVLGNGSTIVRIPATDDTGITSVSATLLQQGRLAACEGKIDLTLTSDSLLEACLTDQPTCSVEFIPSPGEVGVYPPPLYAPIGLEYEITLTDRDGAVTAPVRSTFCFDVGINTPPSPGADTYQLVFPGTIQTSGINYNDRCEKLPGSDGVLFNDDDDEHVTNTCLRAELITPPQFASNLATFGDTFNANGGFRYEGLTSSPETDSFTYRVTDGVNPPSAPVRVDIIFSGGNRPPVAVDDEYTINANTEASALSVLSNDSDPDGLPLTVLQITNGPTAGIARIRNGVVIEYRPNTGFAGTDRFDYVISDSASVTASASVSVQVVAVNQPPVANDDTFTTQLNTSITVDVIANDSDPDNDTITIDAITTPSSGSAGIRPDGQVLYTPDADFTGIDTFEYQLTDGNGGTASAVVTVTVVSTNEPPVALNDRVTTDQNQTVSIEPLLNDSDPDGDTIVIDGISTPTNGSAAIQNNGQILYAPDTDYTGTDEFEYQISDGNGGQASAVITISVQNNNQPPVAANDVVTTEQNQTVNIEPLINDSDPDGDTIVIDSITPPANGSAAIEDNGQILYAPDTDYTGTDEFEYRISDGNGGQASAVITVTVNADNLAPIAVDDMVVTELDDPVRFSPLSNDSDPDGNRISLVSITQPQNGTSTINGNSNRVIYSPASGYIGPDTFEYTIEDNEGATATATVNVTVTPL